MENTQNKLPRFRVCYSTNDVEVDFLPQNRQWQAIATIECTGKRLWASWMSGGITEPDPNNYIVVSYSDDGGITWKDPFVVIDYEDKSIRGRDPVFWQTDEGVLWLYYGFEKTYGVRIPNPEDDECNIIFEEQRIIFEKGMILNKPLLLSTGKYICMFDPYDKERNYSYNCCYESDDKGYTWTKKGEIPSNTQGKQYQEGCVVEKQDGSLWALTRIELGQCGGIEESFSYDKGKTWTVCKNNLSYPFYGPGSKFYMRRLKSGNLFFINNNAPAKCRINMSAYLSKDDGKTWEALLLDYRELCAYPDIAEDNNGYIYSIFDCGRRTRNEIRVCKFSEEDIEKGYFSSSNSYKLKTIAKSPKYSDIVDICSQNGKEAIVITDKGDKIVVEGAWEERIINGLKYDYFNCVQSLEASLITDPQCKLLRLHK